MAVAAVLDITVQYIILLCEFFVKHSTIWTYLPLLLFSSESEQHEDILLVYASA